jgi:hypothetical protein
MINPQSTRKQNQHRVDKSDTTKDVGVQSKEENWMSRLRPIYFLLEQLKHCKNELVHDDNLYDDLLIVFGIELFDSLRRFKVVVKPRKRPRFTSAWRQHICLALEALGSDATYMAVATWIAEHHPYSPLPRYCKAFANVSRDLGYLTANYNLVKDGVDRDVSYVRVKMR